MSETGRVQTATAHFLEVANAAARGKVVGASSHPFPKSGFGGGTINMEFLDAVTWWLDGALLGLPDLAARRARLLEFLGLMHPHWSKKGGTEIGTPTHAQLYYAAMGGLLWGAQRVGDAELLGFAIPLWRGELAFADLCRLPDSSGPWMPGSRAWKGGKKFGPPLASNGPRSTAWRVAHGLLVNDRSLELQKDNVGARFLREYLRKAEPGSLLGGPLPAMPGAFHVRRRQNGDFVAWFESLPTSQPCLAVGCLDGEPWSSEGLNDAVRAAADQRWGPEDVDLPATPMEALAPKPRKGGKG